jgi:uncharacterized protein (DUF58 family)
MQVHKRFYFLLALALLLILAWLYLRDRLLFNLWTGLFLVLLYSYVAATLSLKGISIERRSRIRNQEIGGIFEEHFTVENESRLPKLWLEVIDHCELSSEINSRVIYGLKSHRVHLFSSTLILNKRGFFTLGPTELISGDPFGVFTTRREFPHEDQLMVYPKIFPLRGFPLISADKTGSENLRLQTTHTTPQAAGVREYSPGDPLNRVHWPVTVKYNRLMVKEFDEETQSSVWVFLDARSEAYIHTQVPVSAAFDRNLAPLRRRTTYELPEDSFEYAVSLSASVASHYISKNRYVGFAANAEPAQIIPADKGQRQMTKMLEGLAAVSDNGNLTLPQLLEKQIRNIPKGSSLVLITPVLDKSLEVLLETFKRRGYSSLVFLINNDSFSREDISTIPIQMRSTPDLVVINRGSDLERLFS